jgi:Arc/MetJ family transcription regulator
MKKSKCRSPGICIKPSCQYIQRCNNIWIEVAMRTTLELPDALVNEALTLTKISTKTELIKFALENIIQREKIKELAHYFGKITLDIDLDTLRKR